MLRVGRIISLRSEMNNSRNVIQNLVQAIQVVWMLILWRVLSVKQWGSTANMSYAVNWAVYWSQASNDAYHKKVVSLIFRHHPFIRVSSKTFVLVRCCRPYHSQPPSPRCCQSGRSPAAGSLPIRTTSCACGASHPVGQNHQQIAHPLWHYGFSHPFSLSMRWNMKKGAKTWRNLRKISNPWIFCHHLQLSSPSISLLVAKGMEWRHL